MAEAKRDKLIIYGDSEYAQMIAHYFRSDSAYEVVAFSVDEAHLSKKKIDAIPVVALETLKENFPVEEYAIFSAIGYKSVRMHKNLYEKVARLGYPVARYVSSRAIVDVTSHIGENALILPGVIMEPYSRIEANCFVNSGAIVSHHSHIGAHSIIAAGALIGGHTNVGESSLIGFHATVAELLELAEETLVGANSLVLENTQAYTMYAGTPAKALRTHKENGIVIVPKNLRPKE